MNPEDEILETPGDETDGETPTDGELSISLSADADSIPEGGEEETSQVIFSVNLSQPLEEDARIVYSLTGGNNPVENGSIDIPAGQQQVILTNEITGDVEAEADETLTATVSEAFFVTEAGGQGALITLEEPSAETTVTDDDGDGTATPPTTPTTEGLLVTISAEPNVVPEGAAGETTTITYTVDTGVPLERDARVIVESTGGNNPLASEPLDILAGEQTVTFTNEITGDDEAEPSEILTGTVSFAAFNEEDGSTGEEITVADINTARVAVSDDDGGNDIVYRFFNPNAGVHFYTDAENERSVVEETNDLYNSEGASYRTVDPTAEGAVEVFRFFNASTGVHLYTTAERERDFIIDNNPDFVFEEAVYNAYETEVEGSIPIYRFFEPTIGVHFYTPNEAERDFVANELPNYDSEGIAFYALPLDAPDV